MVAHLTNTRTPDRPRGARRGFERQRLPDAHLTAGEQRLREKPTTSHLKPYSSPQPVREPAGGAQIPGAAGRLSLPADPRRAGPGRQAQSEPSQLRRHVLGADGALAPAGEPEQEPRRTTTSAPPCWASTRAALACSLASLWGAQKEGREGRGLGYYRLVRSRPPRRPCHEAPVAGGPPGSGEGGPEAEYDHGRECAGGAPEVRPLLRCGTAHLAGVIEGQLLLPRPGPGEGEHRREHDRGVRHCGEHLHR